MLLMVIAAFTSQITYFLNLMGAGKIVCLFLVLRKMTSNSFSELSNSNLHTIHQWQITLPLIATVGAALTVFLNLRDEDMEDWRISACFTLVLGPFIYIYCKNYIEEYVRPEKV